MTDEILRRLRKKALSSCCKYHVAAIGLNRRGEVICSCSNRPRFSRYGGSVHAELDVMRRAGPGLCTILLCRVNALGNLLSIEPCKVCLKKAKELGVTIVVAQTEQEKRK